MADETQNPIWDLYDAHRTARLNYKYYCSQLKRTETLNMWIQGILAVAAPTSALAGFGFLEQFGVSKVYSEMTWKIFGVIAAILAVIAPLLKLTEKVKTLEEISTGFRQHEHTLNKIILSVRREREYSEQHYNQFVAAIEERNRIRQPPAPTKQKIREQCQLEVLKELPPSYYYVPGENSSVGEKS